MKQGYFVLLSWYGADESDFGVFGPFPSASARERFKRMLAEDYEGLGSGWGHEGDIDGYEGTVKSPMELIETHPYHDRSLRWSRLRAAQLERMGFEIPESVRAMRVPDPPDPSTPRGLAQIAMAKWHSASVEEAAKRTSFFFDKL